MGIAIGNKIELVSLEQVIRNDQNKRVYVSKIFDILPGGKLQIAMPIYEGRIVPLEVDNKYTACFYTERGLLQCNVVVVSRYKSGNLFFLDVLMLGELQKVQRRQFYRYDCRIDCKIRVVSDYEYETGIPEDLSIPEDELPTWQPGRILDISGGGARLVEKQDLERNEVVKLKFTVSILDEVLRFQLYARILSSIGIQGRAMYEQRMEFLKITQEERDKIIRFIFESERMARAKEKRL
ncbi:MAG: flagellar brake protein [Wujia sp.]